MNKVGLLSVLESQREPRRNRYIVDSLLAIGCIVVPTEIFSLFRLYQTVPDCLLVYLLVILALASIRGLYAALLASFIALLSFDFLFIPPVYSFMTTKFEDFLALLIFLLASITAGQLASTLRKRAEDARHRERETHILYDLVRATNHEEDIERQLHIFACSVTEVFSGLGIRECAVLLPDMEGRPVIRASTHQTLLSSHEEAIARQVIAHAQTMDIHEESSDSLSSLEQVSPITRTRHTVKKLLRKRYLRLIPLKTNQEVVGVLLLLIEDDRQWLPGENSRGLGHGQSAMVFFSTFLEQAVTVIEHGRLQRASLHNTVLRQTDSLRAALLSSVSHDLRTPLTSIKTAATSLLQKDIQLDEETRMNFTIAIEREADHLNRLVENLLDMSRIEGGALHPQKVWYPVDELLHGILRRVQPLLEGREVRVQIPSDLPPVELDYVQIGQVVTNLIENAHRYAPVEFPIDISVQVQQEQILVAVADRGPGVSPPERERIFDKFYRVHREPHAADYKRGSGLGLAVCKGFVEVHDGRIWVEAREGGGAVFAFTLPHRNLDEGSYE